jgi:4-oxalocrotonate tautomerase
MPTVRVEMFAGRTDDQKERLAKAMTDAFVEIGGATPQSVHVIFSDIEKSNWAVGGQLCSNIPAKKSA